MRTFQIQTLSNNLGLIPIGIITDGLTLLINLFGGGGKGSDFPQRKSKLQSWLQRENLIGVDAKYIDNAFLQKILFAGYGTFQNWQNDVQQYLGQIRRVLNGNPVLNAGETDFRNRITTYINKIKKLKGGGGGGLIPITGKPNQSSVSFLPILIMLGAGAFLFFKK